MENKKSKGIVILCAFIAFQAIVSVGLIFFILPVRSVFLNASNEKKIEMIQSENYKNSNITNIEEFDKWWIQQGKIVLNFNYFFQTILLSVFVVGVWFLFNWARIGLILLQLLRFGQNLAGLIMGQHSYTNTASGKIFHLVVAVIIIYYLTRPQIKGQFK